VDVQVPVAYGTEPERVLKLLVEVAESNPEVLRERPPMAFFLGFGESALNFELRFWSANQDEWFQLQSEVAIAVVKALQKAEIEIPFPQRDLHVRSLEPSVRATLAGDSPGPSSLAYTRTPEREMATPSQTPRSTRQK
jgi:small-conductance mechanosensitive channel